MKLSRSLITKAAAAAVVLAAAGTATVAQARSDVYFSVGANVAPGVVIGASNYYGPRYYAPAPVYVQPAPVYVRPSPVYYSAAPTYYAPQAVYYGPQYVDPVIGVTYYWHPQHRRYYSWNHGHRVWR
jgi:hypothetical protein